jgi:hypothetical protein
MQRRDDSCCVCSGKRMPKLIFVCYARRVPAKCAGEREKGRGQDFLKGKAGRGRRFLLTITNKPLKISNTMVYLLEAVFLHELGRVSGSRGSRVSTRNGTPGGPQKHVLAGHENPPPLV